MACNCLKATRLNVSFGIYMVHTFPVSAGATQAYRANCSRKAPTDVYHL